MSSTFVTISAKLGWAVVIVAGIMVALFYANRIFPELPLYAGDEGAYLIRSLLVDSVTGNSSNHPTLQPVGNSAYIIVIRAVDKLTLHVLPWLRIIGALFYVGGLLLLIHTFCTDLTRRQKVGLVALALLFPYYRFAFTAMPEGIYVGLLCCIITLTALLYRPRPLAHAFIAGILTAVLVLVKPHGLVVALSYGLLVVLEACLRNSNWQLTGLRLLAFGVSFIVAGSAVDLVVQGQPGQSLTFFLGNAYSDHLSRTAPADGLWLGALGVGSMIAVLALFAAPPLLAASWAIGCGAQRAWREGVGFSRDEVALLFTLLIALGTVSMVGVFTYKVSAIDGERYRLWGRYFEFLVPILWIVSALHLQRWLHTSHFSHRAIWMAVTLGAAGLVVSLLLGVMLFPWDGTAVTAFFFPDTGRWGFAPGFPFGMLALLSTAALLVAAIFRLDVYRSWAAYFVALGVLSTAFDDAWVGEIALQRTDMEHELHVALGLMNTDPGRSIVVVHDQNAAHIAYMRLGPNVRIKLAAPGTIGPGDVEGYDWVVIVGREELPRPWQKPFDGFEVDLYGRDEVALK